MIEGDLFKERAEELKMVDNIHEFIRLVVPLLLSDYGMGS